MPRTLPYRALLALVLLITAGWLTVTKPARLGLDLRGGTQITLETQSTATRSADAETTDRTLEVLRRRVDALGVAEPTLARAGERRIIVELPGVTDPRQAAEVIGRTAQLTFHPVEGPGDPEQVERATASSPADPPTAGSASPPAGASPAPGRSTRALDQTERRSFTLVDEDGQALRVGPAALTGEGVGGAQAAAEQLGGFTVNVEFTGSGDAAWTKLTAAAACQAPGDPQRRVAIVLDGRVISSPQVSPEVRCDVGIVGGSTSITGDFDRNSAEELAVLIRGGALPVPVEIIEQRTVGPTLGAEAVRASVQAAVLGGLATIVFLCFVYRLAGVLAALALLAYGLLSYAVLLSLGATLTLPGIAGFVLAIGMAVDANVLVFERAREETAARVPLRRAVQTGFAKALSAIADSNITTLLAAVLLFFLAAGPVRGFGVTLSVGVLVSMFTALVITRVLLEVAVTTAVVRARPAVTGLAHLGAVRTWLGRANPDVMGRRRWWLALSALAVVLALAGVAVRGLNYGVEFTGGRLLEFRTATPIAVEQARAAVSDAGLPRAVVQTSGEAQVTVRAGGISDDVAQRLPTELTDAGAGSVTLLRDEFIGPSLGEELRRKGLIALGLALLAQLAYLAVRFRWTFGVAAVAAMAHDVALLVGVFAWLGKPIDGVFLAALLTVIGYSVNDSVVVFDRVRELRATARRRPFSEVANDAALQTVPRTVNTGLGAVFILAALAVLGGESLVDFAVALLIGIIVGTYSSVFTATPLAVVLETAGGGSNPARRGQPAKRRSAPATGSSRGRAAAGSGRARGGSGAVV